jgi:uncharacterized protein (DUF1778 family)
MASRKVGRPKKPEGEARDLRLEIRVTAEERQRLQRAAETAGKTLSDWLRDVAVREASG